MLGDRRRLQRVLVNLLDNARAHAGGAVGVRVDRCGDEAEVAVDDVGPGVQPAERSAIFERFYRGRGRRPASRGPQGRAWAWRWWPSTSKRITGGWTSPTAPAGVPVSSSACP